jgi:transcriptional regulator with XRE-family HTH domain
MKSWDKFKMLCDQNGLTVSEAMENAGLSKALATKWKNADESYTPNGVTLAKLSKYFNVSADYFLDNGETKVSTFNEIPEIAIIAKAMRKMTEQQRREVIRYAKYIAPNTFG